MKRYILLVLLIIWMGIIFYFSSQGSTSSTKQSDVIINDGIIKTVKIFDKNLDENSLYLKLYTPVRKNAHLFEYFVLGLLSYLYINTYKISKNKKFLISIIFCFLYACSDEIHQVYVPGRDGRITDVLIDTLGSFICLTIIFIKIKINEKYLHKSKNDLE